MTDSIEKNRMDLISLYKSKSVVVKGRPVTLNIESTNICNLKCVMCPRRFMTRKLGMMDYSLFKKVIDESRGFVELVRLHLFGEPLLHDKIIDMINYAEKSGISTVISTNALMLDDKISEQILTSDLSFLVLSLDAAKKDTYDILRTSHDFEKVKSNIENFLMKMSGKNSQKLIVAVQMIRMLQNEHEESLFIKQWIGKQNVHIFFKDFSDWAGQVEEINLLGCTQPQISSQNKSHCFNLWNSLSIYWDGTVVPCCYDYNGEYIVGNIQDQTLFSIWNNEKMQTIRKAHSAFAQDKIKLCSKCNIWHCIINPEDPLSPFYQKNSVTKTFSTEITGENINLKNINLIANTDVFSLGNGWYGLENWPPMVRWTQKEAFVLFNVNKPSKFNIKILTSCSDILDVNIFLNNRFFEKLKLKQSEWILFSLDIPESEVGKKTEIAIKLDKIWVPKDILKTKDDRKLGVAISEMWLEQNRNVEI